MGRKKGGLCWVNAFAQKKQCRILAKNQARCDLHRFAEKVSKSGHFSEFNLTGIMPAFNVAVPPYSGGVGLFVRDA